MNSTYFALMAEFGTGTVPLASVCEKYFGLNEAQAQRRARNHQLPLPIFRGAKSQKSPMLVNISDLAQHLDKMRAEAESEFIAVNY
ncbi:pyocin activator PrtN family protein [Psychromonas sp. MME2]|uniref:pyocin activator PrtN family protein n=1 Tax=unclassified Psychromonas TaxID=2614957 RepID=UPI00339CB481